jgi:hypothetical protein
MDIILPTCCVVGWDKQQYNKTERQSQKTQLDQEQLHLKRNRESVTKSVGK